MDIPEIVNLERVLLLKPGQTISSYNVKRFTKPGDNFGSLVLGIHVTAKTEDGFEQIQTVAKLAPPNDFIQKVFNTQVTFRNEIAFYKHIIPTLQDFQRRENIREVLAISAKFYGARINLEDDDDADVDSNAILLLGNLKTLNYVVLDRFEGVDLPVARLILKDLAHLHAVSLALKIKNPSLFEEKINKFLDVFKMKDQDRHIATVEKQLEKILEHRHLTDRIIKGLKVVPDSNPRPPFATVTHNDVWVNNFMVKFVGSTPVKTKLLDYQGCSLGSPAKDVLFFLFSSVQETAIEKEYDSLIQLYHAEFIKTLKEHHCDITPFSMKNFLKELDYEAKNRELYHIVMMLIPIFAPRGSMKDIHEMTPEDFLESANKVGEPYFKRLAFIIKEWVQRKWV